MKPLPHPGSARRRAASRHHRRDLDPGQARTKTFGTRWRGLDPVQVYAYLRRLAAEIARLRRAESAARTEADRLRTELHQWQARHARCWFVDPHRHTLPGTPNRGHW
ncbi:DivIVA domain-containing protein [Plantactinospora sp. WMMB334]|uniref:DivIVA domain-containing protein n=1 Tax=Plantactinospora sp. WMMB334 TaxID=3404119 RepID=UPI003B963A33